MRCHRFPLPLFFTKSFFYTHKTSNDLHGFKSVLRLSFILACYVHYHSNLLLRPRVFCRYLVSNIFLMCPLCIFFCILFLTNTLGIVTSFA